MILPTSLSLLNAMFTGKARGQAFAVWGSTIGAASAPRPIARRLACRTCLMALGIRDQHSACCAHSDRRSAVHRALTPHRWAHRRHRSSTVHRRARPAGLRPSSRDVRTGGLTTKEPFDLFGLSWSSGPSPVLVALVLAVLSPRCVRLPSNHAHPQRRSVAGTDGRTVVLHLVVPQRQHRDADHRTRRVRNRCGASSLAPVHARIQRTPGRARAGSHCHRQLCRQWCELRAGIEGLAVGLGPYRPGSRGARSRRPRIHRCDRQPLVDYRRSAVLLRNRRRFCDWPR